MNEKILTNQEIEDFLDQWTQVSEVKPFDRRQGWIGLNAQIEVIQAVDVEVHSRQLKAAHEHLAFAVFSGDELEVRRARLLVFWSRFQHTVAARKAEVRR